MNPKGFGRSGFGNFSGKHLFALPLLALLAALVTGCPHNEYTVELKPTASGVERTLTFYRADGTGSNDAPNYLDFPTNELAAISQIYPPGAVKADGKRFVAHGKFFGALPGDVGGAGSFTNLTTSLGTAGFYLERFRGNDDLTGQTEKRFHAADQLTDLTLGWAKMEFGSERGWKKLRKFLDEDFRRDLKNAGLYFWTGQISALNDTNATEEFTARFSQYLIERGYLKFSDAPQVCSLFNDEGGTAAGLNLLQRLVAEKMEIPENDPLPKSLAVFNDPAAFEKSWERYLAKSDLYRTQLKEWEQKRKTDAKLEAPKPLNAMDNLFADLLTDSGGEADHLTVKLKLAQAPSHTNGKWQDGQIVWNADLDADRPLPAICYASWSHPDNDFQKTHFGRVLLEGDELMQYCLWESSLDEEESREWKTFLVGLKQGQNLKQELEAFRFVGGPNEEIHPPAGCKMILDQLLTAK